MNIRRLGLVLAMGALVWLMNGCGSGSGGSGGATFDVTTLRGTWERIRQSNDAGQNWTDTTDGFRFTFVDGTNWTDNQNRSGTYLLNNTHLTVARTGVVNTNIDIYMYSTRTLMRWTYYTNDSFGTTTGVIVEYNKIN